MRPSGPNTALLLHLVPLGPTATTEPDVAVILPLVPGIERDSLLSIPKFAVANYVAIFDKDKVNIYDANKTTIGVS